MDKDKNNRDLFKSIRLGHMAVSLGIGFIIWSFLGFYGGRLLDQKFGTEPWLMVLGILLGISFALYGFVKEMLVLTKAESNTDSSKKKE
ncbi:MAG: AtpZ/AtpI family protein [Bacillota bacterium]